MVLRVNPENPVNPVKKSLHKYFAMCIAIYGIHTSALKPRRTDKRAESLTAEPFQEGVIAMIAGDKAARSSLRFLMILPSIILSDSENFAARLMPQPNAAHAASPARAVRFVLTFPAQ